MHGGEARGHRCKAGAVSICTMAHVLVTGSNRGIGLALVRHLLARGDRNGASADFTKVLKAVPQGSDAAKRAELGLRGELPGAEPSPAASRPSKDSLKP